jgi:PPM family protein phosphatase
VKAVSDLFKVLFRRKKKKSENLEKEMIEIISSEISQMEKDKTTKSSFITNQLYDVYNTTTGGCRAFSCYRFYTASQVGKVKESNQDSMYTAELKWYNNNSITHCGMAIIADGMGGLAAGEKASAAAISSISTFMQARFAEYLKDGLPNRNQVLEHINNAVQNANIVVKNRGIELGEEIGTTLTLTVLIGGTAYLAHVGDSRAYIINKEAGTIEKITRDHSLVARLVEMGHLSEKEAKTHPRRNEIYRMLGLRDELEVDTFWRIIDEKTIILLLTDGLWEFVDDSDILAEMLEHIDLSSAAESLANRANSSGGLDNISIIIIEPFI